MAAGVLAFRDHLTVPFVDDWRFLDDYQSKPLAGYLLTPQNGHHIPSTLALFALDHELLGGRGHLLVAVSLACVGVTLLALHRVFGGSAGRSDPIARIVLGFACFSLVWAVSFHDLLWPVNATTSQTVMFLVVGLASVVLAEPSSGAALGLAALCALLATFSSGTGASAWAGLVTVALLRGAPGRRVGALVAAAAAALALRALTIPPQPNVSLARSLQRTLTDPLSLVDFSLPLLGSAPARVALGLAGAMPHSPRDLAGWRTHHQDLHTTALALGAAGVALLAALAGVRWRRAPRSPTLEAFGLALMSTGLAAALLVGFVRLPEPGHEVAIRWVTWSTLFWMGAVCSLAPRAGPHPARARLAPAVLLLPILSLGMLPALGDARALHAMKRSQATRLALALLLDVRHDRLAAGVALADPDLVYRVAARLEREGRHPFDDPRRSLRGERLGDHFEAVGPCPQGAARLRPLPAAEAAAIRGSVGLASGRPRFLVVTDSSGVIRGLGDEAASAPVAGAAPSAARPWAGFVAGYAASERYVAWAVLPDGRSACHLPLYP